MKKSRNKKATPEESLRKSCEAGLGVELDYTRVREKLDVDAIARAGASKRALSAKPAASPIPPRRSAVATVCLVLAVLVLIPAAAVGSFVIARMTMGDEPPVESLPPQGDVGSVIHPLQDGTKDPTEVITTEPAIVYPFDVQPTTPIPLAPSATGEAWGNLFDLSVAYTTDDVLFLRAEHLHPTLTDGTLPAVLTISDLTTWHQFCSDPTLDITSGAGETAEEFFRTHSLLVVITEGRSGSIRYRLDKRYVTADNFHVVRELVAEVPPALTMDIVHWCVVIPVTKAEAEQSVYLTWRDESTEETADPTLYFLGYGDGSHAGNGYLYGRVSELSDMTYPDTQVVSSFAEWQAMLDSDNVADPTLDADFTAGLVDLNANFFDEKSLLIVYLEEGSGSIRHSVDTIITEEDKRTVRITATVPCIFTADMAYWAILIPIAKGTEKIPVTLEFETVQLE